MYGEIIITIIIIIIIISTVIIKILINYLKASKLLNHLPWLSCSPAHCGTGGRHDFAA